MHVGECVGEWSADDDGASDMADELKRNCICGEMREEVEEQTRKPRAGVLE